VAVADFDEDGSLDLAFAVRGTGTGVYVLTQRPGGPTGQLWNTRKIAIPREDYKFDNLKVVDIDGDADLDILSSEENVGPDSHGLGVVYYANPLREANRAAVARCGNVLVAADAQCHSQFASIDTGSSDPNAADDLTRVQSPAGPYGLGFTWVELTVVDSHGFYDVRRGNVDHRDLSGPQLSCSSGLVELECAAPTGTAAAYPFAVTDNCDPAPVSSCSIPQGSLLGLGTTRSECIATDRDGNRAGCGVLLRVVDTLRPDVVAPGAIVAECASASGTSVALGTASASDRCDGPRPVTNDAPALFPSGTTTVTWTARDVTSNVGTATQLVTIRDTVAPAITAPAAGIFECTSPAGYPKSGIGSPVTSDTCDPMPQVTSDAPTTLPLGMHTVVWTARDDANNAHCGPWRLEAQHVERPRTRGERWPGGERLDWLAGLVAADQLFRIEDDADRIGGELVHLQLDAVRVGILVVERNGRPVVDGPVGFDPEPLQPRYVYSRWPRSPYVKAM
jgi:hypothetical protein